MTAKEINDLMRRSPDDLYRALMNELGRYVYVIVFNKLRSCGTNEDIEECVSDIFAELFIAVEDGGVNDVKKLAASIANRRAVDHFRRLTAKGRDTMYVDDEEFPELADQFSVEDISDTKELRRILLREISSLGEPDSTILMQKFYYNKTSAEIAKNVKMTASSVRSRCTRAIERLRVSLSAVGITR